MRVSNENVSEVMYCLHSTPKCSADRCNVYLEVFGLYLVWCNDTLSAQRFVSLEAIQILSLAATSHRAAGDSYVFNIPDLNGRTVNSTA
jgi:hypothetical protein